MDTKACLDFAKELAHQAGAIMKKYWQSDTADTHNKSDQTIVTLADTEINTMIIDKIGARYPGHSIWGEEEKKIKDNAEYTWVCDPVDGTMPFAKGLPVSTFLLALVDESGKSIVGVAYDPFTDTMFEAVVGRGAFRNGTRMCVSATTTLAGSYIDEELWINHEEGISFDNPKDRLNKQDAKVITYCSSGITGCMVADGKFDAMIFGQTKPEDIAALAVIVTEAGGRVTDLFGHEQRYDRPILGAVVSNGSIHKDIVAITSTMNYKNPHMS